MSRLITRVLFATLWLPMLGLAQTSTQTPLATSPAPPPFVAAPAKLAVVDLDGAILSCEQGKKELAELQKYMEAKKAEMDNLKKDVDNLQNKIQVQGTSLTDEARGDLEDQLEMKNTALQRFQQDAQKDVDNRRQRIGNNIGNKLLPIIKKVAQEKGVNWVQFFSQNRDAYVDPSLNLTDEVVKAFNAAYAAGAKAPEIPSPAKKP
jgi:outer membrane protein